MVRETHAGECARSVAHTQAHSHAHFVQAANVNMSKSVQVRVQYSLDASGAAERGRSAAGQPEGGGDCRGSSASPSSSTRHSSARLQHAWSSGGGRSMAPGKGGAIGAAALAAREPTRLESQSRPDLVEVEGRD